MCLKLSAGFWAISYAKFKIKSICRNRRADLSTGNGTEKMSAFHIVLQGSQPKVSTWDCGATLLVVLVKLPLDRFLSYRPITVSGNPSGDLYAEIHKAVFVVVVKGAVKYKGEEFISEKEPKK